MSHGSSYLVFGNIALPNPRKIGDINSKARAASRFLIAAHHIRFFAVAGRRVLANCNPNSSSFYFQIACLEFLAAAGKSHRLPFNLFTLANLMCGCGSRRQAKCETSIVSTLRPTATQHFSVVEVKIFVSQETCSPARKCSESHIPWLTHYASTV